MTPLLCTRGAVLQFLGILFTAVLIPLTSPSAARAQTKQASSYDPLQAFVGTWTARNTNESTPYLFLRIQEGDGKLSGTISHFSLHAPGGRPFQPLIGAAGPAGESPITDIKVGNGELDFMWSGDGSL